jgi:hypothetical protein
VCKAPNLQKENRSGGDAFGTSEAVADDLDAGVPNKKTGAFRE